jgi:hypothetical protein
LLSQVVAMKSVRAGSPCAFVMSAMKRWVVAQPMQSSLNSITVRPCAATTPPGCVRASVIS